jgi:hypothetical protein
LICWNAASLSIQAPRPDHVRQPDQAAAGREDAALYLGQGEQGLLRADGQVTRQHELESSAVGQAVHGSEDRLGRAEPQGTGDDPAAIAHGRPGA